MKEDEKKAENSNEINSNIILDSVNNEEFQFKDIIRVNKKVSTILNKSYKNFFVKKKC